MRYSCCCLVHKVFFGQFVSCSYDYTLVWYGLGACFFHVTGCRSNLIRWKHKYISRDFQSCSIRGRKGNYLRHRITFTKFKFRKWRKINTNIFCPKYISLCMRNVMLISHIWGVYLFGVAHLWISLPPSRKYNLN